MNAPHRRLVGLAVVAVTSLSAGQALALCPNCLGQTRAFTTTLSLVGAFLLVPFLIAFIAFRRIRRATTRARSPGLKG